MAQSTLLEADLFTGKVALPPSMRPMPPQYADDSDTEQKADQAFKTISEAADMLALPAHVLRFWESKFGQLKPLKLRGGRRYYRPQDIETLETIKQLLYKEGYTIKGARKALSETKKRKDPAAEPQTTARAQEKPTAAPAPKKSAALHETPLFQTFAPAPAGQSVSAALAGIASAPTQGYTTLAYTPSKPVASAPAIVAAPKPAQPAIASIAVPVTPAPFAAPAAPVAVQAHTSMPVPQKPAAAAPAPVAAEALKPAAPAPVNAARKAALSAIYAELLELKEMIGQLETV